MGNLSVINKEPSIIWATNQLIDNRIDANYFDIKYINYLNDLLSSGLECKTFEEICKRMNSGPFGSALLASAYVEEGIPFIRPLNCKDYIVEGEEFVFITNKDSNRLKSSSFNSGSLIITKIGNGIGDVAIIPIKYTKCNISGNLMGVEVKEAYDKYYILSFLKSKFGQNQIWQGMMNSAKPKIDMYSIRSIQIPIPSPEIQKYIGDKVRKAEELREEAIKLKEEAEEFMNKKLGTLNLDEDKQYSSAFIPNHKIIDRIDSEYYNIRYLNIEEEFEKRGYKIKTLDELCTRIYNGKTYSTSIKESKYINIGVGELGDWFINKNSEKFINDTINKKYCLKKNSIIWGNAAHLAKYIGEKVNMIFEDDVIIPTTEVTAIEPNEEVIDPYYLFLFMRSQWGYYQIQRTVKGMTAHSYPQDIERILVPIIELTTEEKEKLKNYVLKSFTNEVLAKQLIQEAKQDVEDLIEGNFDMSKLNETTTESR